MSTPNKFGYSTRMNPKLRKLLEQYRPEDRSERTALRNKQPLWSMNTIQKVKLNGVSDDVTPQEMVNGCIIVLVCLLLMTLAFNV